MRICVSKESVCVYIQVHTKWSETQIQRPFHFLKVCSIYSSFNYYAFLALIYLLIRNEVLSFFHTNARNTIRTFRKL